MDQNEWDSTETSEWTDEATEVCAQCGARVAPAAERGFKSGVSVVLCWQCAIERGGQYDEERDEWIVKPHLEDLPDEAYGTAPHEVRETRR